MRRLLLIGSAAATLILGASSAYAIPPNSPYAIWAPQAVDGAMAPEDYSGGPNLLNPLGLFEGRSAYEAPAPDTLYGAPVQLTSTEDATYFSRGR
jgi:hypothetical protein